MSAVPAAERQRREAAAKRRAEAEAVLAARRQRRAEAAEHRRREAAEALAAERAAAAAAHDAAHPERTYTVDVVARGGERTALGVYRERSAYNALSAALFEAADLIDDWLLPDSEATTLTLR